MLRDLEGSALVVFRLRRFEDPEEVTPFIFCKLASFIFKYCFDPKRWGRRACLDFSQFLRNTVAEKGFTTQQEVGKYEDF